MSQFKFTRSLMLGFALSMTAAACTPSPEKVCGHLKEIIKDKDMQDTSACTAMMTLMKSKMGDDKWKTASKCLMDAKDENSAEACMKAAK